MVLSLECHWIRTCCGTLLCRKSPAKKQLEICKNKSKSGKMYANEKMYVKNNFKIKELLYNSLKFVPLIKKNVQQFFKN